MTVLINAPAVRSLSANEKRVYQLLKEGKTPWEIARALHLALGSVNDLHYSYHDVMPDTVVNIITNIRSKGWEIPENNKIEEESEMSTVKLTEEIKREIITLKDSGMKVTEIAKKFAVDKSSVYNVIRAYSEHGENAFDDLQSKADEIFEKVYEEEDFEREKSETANDDPCYCVTADTDIDAYIADKSDAAERDTCNDIPDAVKEACWSMIDHLSATITQEQAVIDDCRHKINEINAFLQSAATEG